MTLPDTADGTILTTTDTQKQGILFNDNFARKSVKTDTFSLSGTATSDELTGVISCYNPIKY